MVWFHFVIKINIFSFNIELFYNYMQINNNKYLDVYVYVPWTAVCTTRHSFKQLIYDKFIGKVCIHSWENYNIWTHCIIPYALATTSYCWPPKKMLQPSRQQVLRLYKHLIKYGNHLTLTDKNYFLGRVRHEFRENRQLTNPLEIEFNFKVRLTFSLYHNK